MKKKKQIISKRDKDAHAGPDMKPHGHTQDMSFEPLSELLSQGYTRCECVLGATHTNPENACENFQGTELSIEALLNNCKHGATIFSLTHVGCTLNLRCFSNENPELPEEWVCAGGRGRDIPPPVEEKGFE